MKKVFLAFAIMVSLVSFGQEREGRGKLVSKQDVEERIKEMTKELNLSEKQQSDIKILLTEQHNKRMKLREEMKKDKESGTKVSDERKAELKKYMIDEQLAMKTKMKTILTEEQYKKLGELRKERRKENQEEKKD